jgi:SAM-dependent methyltransferase
MTGEMPSADSPYDRIAQWYDVDMAANMRFDDVAFYADLCEHERGRVLELGCGNGRILLELVRRGIDAVGVDTSSKMLQQLRLKADANGLHPSVCRMDARELAFAREFDVVLCPYSLVTYMSQPGELERALAGVRDVLRTDGLIVLDAFVPRGSVVADGYQLDYRRPLGEKVLARYKRVQPISSRLNRIERRYEVLTEEGAIVESVETCEHIRTFAPEELTDALSDAGFAKEESWWDYGQASADSQPQFFTVSARPTRGA